MTDMPSDAKSKSDTAINPSTDVAVGRVKDAHGLKGELYIRIFSGEVEWLAELKKEQKLRLRSGVAVKDYTLLAAKVHKDGLIVRTEELKDRTQAEACKGFEMDVPEHFFVSQKGEALYLREIHHFSVWNWQTKEEVGEIKAFSFNGAHDLLLVETNKGEFAIPFVKEFVKEIDYQTKKVWMEIPFGLLGEEDE